jgi:hypothetical protein
MDPGQRLYLAAAGRQIVLRPDGRCSAVLSQAIERYLGSLPSPDALDVYFDLSLATMLESTFAGFLALLARRSAGAAAPAVHLLTPSEPAVNALAVMGLLKRLHVCDAPPEPPGEWRALPVEGADPDALADLIIRSHESLIAEDPCNAAAFGGVVEGFRAERARRRPEGGGAGRPS